VRGDGGGGDKTHRLGGGGKRAEKLQCNTSGTKNFGGKGETPGKVHERRW